MSTWYRRPLPAEHIAFDAPAGRTLLTEALADGTAASFFALVAHLHTQADPAWCGLGTLVTVLNALQIDPGRPWKGPWRYFGEELLDCCRALDDVRAQGISLAELDCLARCQGAAVERHHADDEAAFRAALAASVTAHTGPFLVVNYDRATLGQTGSGHFSPVAAWHRPSDRLLVLDVARFKYPPHWVEVGSMWRALQTADPSTGTQRGWMRIGVAESPAATPAEADALKARLCSLVDSCRPRSPHGEG